MEIKTKQTGTVNGVNVDKLFETIAAVKESPVIARFKFSLDNEWKGGGLNRSTICNFYGTCEDIEREKPFVLDADEPPVLLGQDRGPNPVEYLLKALTACVTTGIVYHAAARGIVIEELESTVSGNIDLQGFLGVNDDVRRGYESIKMQFRIKADVSDEELEELCQLGRTYSPVYDSVTNGVPVSVTAVRK